MTEFANNMG